MLAAPPPLVEALFDLAVQKQDAAERGAFLDGVCQGNPALRSRLDQLLEGHFAADDFLTGSLKRPEPAPVPEPAEARLPPDAQARMIGRYRLLEKIGEGGFGEVWMAEQREPVKRRVALKIVKTGMVSDQAVARFEAGRQALALMDHANIARVFDGGTTGLGRPSFSPQERIAALLDSVQGLEIPFGLKTALTAKLNAALAALALGDTAAACQSLLDFINLASAQSGKKLTAEDAAALIAEAASIREQLGCP